MQQRNLSTSHGIRNRPIFINIQNLQLHYTAQLIDTVVIRKGDPDFPIVIHDEVIYFNFVAFPK